MTADTAWVGRKYRHLAEKKTYEELGDGRVRVTHDDGRSGIFGNDGRWLEGDLTQVNIHMVVWTGGPPVRAECQYHWMQTPIDLSRPSGWPEEYERILPHQMGPQHRIDPKRTA